ncbi:MAG: 50S ribosomal protein L24 [Candidatus Nanoarchaeia archaeon]
MKYFSIKWRSSSLPKKQRRYRTNAPLHLRHKMIAGHLSKELRLKYKKRSLPIRKGDKVKIMRGKFRGIIGDVEKVDLHRYKVFVKGAELQKKEGAPKVSRPIDPSKLMLVSLNLDDKKRLKVLERR